MSCLEKDDIAIKLQLLSLTRDIWYRISEKKYYGLTNINTNDPFMIEQHKQKVIQECLNEIDSIYHKLIELLEIDPIPNSQQKMKGDLKVNKTVKKK